MCVFFAGAFDGLGTVALATLFRLSRVLGERMSFIGIAGWPMGCVERATMARLQDNHGDKGHIAHMIVFREMRSTSESSRFMARAGGDETPARIECRRKTWASWPALHTEAAEETKQQVKCQRVSTRGDGGGALDPPSGGPEVSRARFLSCNSAKEGVQVVFGGHVPPRATRPRSAPKCGRQNESKRARERHKQHIKNKSSPSTCSVHVSLALALAPGQARRLEVLPDLLRRRSSQRGVALRGLR